MLERAILDNLCKGSHSLFRVFLSAHVKKANKLFKSGHWLGFGVSMDTPEAGDPWRLRCHWFGFGISTDTPEAGGPWLLRRH